MLQKLTTQKHIIKSSDITKDRNTHQIQLSLEGKKRSDTGGLSGTLTVAINVIVDSEMDFNRLNCFGKYSLYISFILQPLAV